MGKLSIKSRKTSQIRKKNRKNQLIRQIKNKEEEIADLQIQMHDFKKGVEDVGEKVIDKINKCSQENNNLVKWLKLYDEQLNNYQQEVYDLNVKLYFSSQQMPQQKPSLSQSQHQPQHQLQQQPQHQPQQQQPQQTLAFKSLDDYFRSQK